MLYFQSTGKSPELCNANSVFAADLAACNSCLEVESDDTTKNKFVIDYIQNYYGVGIDFCDAVPPQSQILSIASTSSGILATPLALRTPQAVQASLSTTSLPVTRSPVSSASRVTSTPTNTTTYPYGFWLVYTFKLCPTPTNTAPVTPQDTSPSSLWGCAPGYVCSPPQVDCNLEPGPPTFDYLVRYLEFLVSPQFFEETVWII